MNSVFTASNATAEEVYRLTGTLPPDIIENLLQNKCTQDALNAAKITISDIQNKLPGEYYLDDIIVWLTSILDEETEIKIAKKRIAAAICDVRRLQKSLNHTCDEIYSDLGGLFSDFDDFDDF